MLSMLSIFFLTTGAGLVGGLVGGLVVGSMLRKAILADIRAAKAGDLAE